MDKIGSRTMTPLPPFAAKYSEIILATFGGGHYTATLPMGLDMDARPRHRVIYMH